MDKQSVNTFVKGMQKDLDKSVQTNNSYLNADNFRIVTSEGASSGALENIKGNNWLGVDSLLERDQRICGSIRVRDYIILFTTNNSTATPSGGRSMIYKLILDKTLETQSSLTVLYDDNLNGSTGTLNFSIANTIKAVAKYETPNIQKIYWTDGYNNLRYADVAKNLTITGSVYTLDNYMAPEMFEFLPLFTSTKPTLSNITGGHLMSGMVQYAYQLYRLNGAETAFSPVSDMIHIVTDNDFATNTSNYNGDFESVETGKGCKLTIVNTNTGYNRLRLIRIHYSTLNSIPIISVASEIEIGTSPSTITINDIGDNVSSLTLDEFNISSTELFKCEDIAIKGDRLFAANIEKDEFLVDNWDARAVRFRNYTDAAPPPASTDTVFSSGLRHGYSGVTFENFAHANQVFVTVPNASVVFNIPTGRTMADVTTITTTRTSLPAIDGEWHEVDHTAHTYSAIGSNTTFTVQSYDAGTDELQFVVTGTSGISITLALYDHMSTVGDGSVTCDIFDIIYTYAYTTPGLPITYTDAVVYDGNVSTTINVPVDPTVVADWDTANWVSYTNDHDGINRFNDTDNDGDDAYGFKYQSDGITLGAEGPNIKIDFQTESIILDNSNSYTTFSTTSGSESYTNFASPWMDGNLSFQRDEVYRYFVVWSNDRGQKSQPQWIIDLRMPSLHDAGYSTLASEAAGIVTTTILRPRIYFRSMPDNATSCQIYRVKREREDRSVVTQGLAIPTLAGAISHPDLTDDVIPLAGANELIKLVSPEINITKNINKRNNDYIEYVTYFSTAWSTDDEPLTHRRIEKLVENTAVAYGVNVRSDINDVLTVEPAIDALAPSFVQLNGDQYCNYHAEGTHTYSKGCSGLLISYVNTSWSAENVARVLVNYKADVFDSQYGGNTYEDRTLNVSIPCSDVISTISAWHSITGGDTFINYFDVSTLLVDMSLDNLSYTLSESVFVPLESSINCDLRHDTSNQHSTASIPQACLRQEYAGEHTFIDTAVPVTVTYNQEKDLYLYNTVYSQQTSVQNAISEMLDTSDETVFDCLVKASNVKYNGENSDSWTNFNINEEIEVDSNYGEIRAIETFNEKLLYWQEDAFGVLAVNDRSLIQDASGSQLVLGTGGVLARYDYISSTIGIDNKKSLVNSDSSIYWFYDKDTSIYRFNNTIANLTKDKGMWSWFKTNYTPDYFIHGIYDRAYNEIIYTLYKVDQTGYTLAFNEQTDQFTSFYDFVPRMYIDYKDGYLTTKEMSGYWLMSGRGLTYNWYAAIGDVAPTGWHVPSATEWTTLETTLGGILIAGGEMKETGTSHWLTPNTGATNSSGFSGIPTDIRYSTGLWSNYSNWYSYWWSTTAGIPSTDGVGRGLYYANTILSVLTASKNYGLSIRCIKDDSTWSAGDTVTDYDGNIYDTIKIGTQVWTVQNLMVTHYNDGTVIPEVIDNTDWSYLATGAYCTYNNDPSILQYGSLLYMHNSNISPRCRFYSLLGYTDEDSTSTYASTIKLLYNADYPITKVFDNIFYISNAYDESTDADQYNTTFDQVRCYNDYQNSGWVDLVYSTNIMRRERGWSTTVPRNLLEAIYTSSPDIFSASNIDSDATKVWHERIRDKYMVLDLSFDNASETRFVVPFVGIKYRLSYR